MEAQSLKGGTDWQQHLRHLPGLILWDLEIRLVFRGLGLEGCKPHAFTFLKEFGAPGSESLIWDL